MLFEGAQDLGWDNKRKVSLNTTTSLLTCLKEALRRIAMEITFWLANFHGISNEAFWLLRVESPSEGVSELEVIL